MIELSSLDQALSLFRKKLKEMGDPPIHYVGNRGTDSFSLQAILEKIDYPLETVICLDYSAEHEKISAVKIVSYEKHQKTRTNQYSGLWQDGFFKAMLKKEGVDLASGSLLFSFSNFPDLDLYCREKKIKILGPKSDLRIGLENKIQLMNLLSDESIPSLPSKIISLKDVDFKAYRQYFKTDTLVFQIPLSASGNGTHIVRNKIDFKRLVDNYSPETIFKVTQYIEGISFAVTGCLTDHGTIWVPPAAQIIGEEVVGILSSREPIYAGSDFFTSDKIIKKYLNFNYLNSIASFLYRKGYRGIFNLDILSRGHHFCDLNSRCPGSIRMITELEMLNNEIPIVLIQMLQFLDIDFNVTKCLQEFSSAASMMVMHSLQLKPTFDEFSIKPGIFRFDGNHWVWNRHGFRLEDFKNSEEILLTGGVPSGKYEIKPEAPLGRIWMKKTIVNEQMIVTPEAIRIGQEMYNMMRTRQDTKSQMAFEKMNLQLSKSSY